jgi:hypothetical protein
VPIVVNYYDEVIYITSSTTDVTVQALVDAIRAEEDSPVGMAFGGATGALSNAFIDATGKDDLGAGKATGIVMTLHSDWYIEFWDGVVLGTVKDGNVVGGLDSRPVRAEVGSADTVLQLGAVGATLVDDDLTSLKGLIIALDD